MNNNIPQQIKEYNTNREKGPLKLKYKAMAEDPFRFFRGSCPLFYAELFAQYPFPASPNAWICGDLHIENFGSFKGSNGLVYFDMNDFDEAMLAPALCEISRLVVSVQIAANQSKFSKKEKERLVNGVLSSYRNTLQKAKAMVVEKETARGLIKKLINNVCERKEMELVRKRTKGFKMNQLRITDTLFGLGESVKEPLMDSFNKWLDVNAHNNLQAIDAGFRIAGTGSLGVKRYALLVEHKDNKRKKLLIDVKQALPPAPGPFISTTQPVWKNEASRIIAVQEMMQHVSPAFLSALHHDGEWFVVKDLQPTADRVNVIQTIKQPAQTESYFSDLGMLSASAQIRSSGRKGAATADELSDFAASDGWVGILNEWCTHYAEQVTEDYKVYKKAWQKGFFKSKSTALQ